MVVQRGQPDYYKQSDKDDDLASLQMIMDNLKIAEKEKALASTTLINYIKGKEYKMN